MNFKNYLIKFISWTMSIVFILLGSTIKLEAKELKNYDIHTYKSRRYGASFAYKKNDDGKNTITLLSITSISKTRNIKISSPINSYKVTKIADNFSSQSGKSKVWNHFFKTLSTNTKIFFRNAGRGIEEAVIAITPLLNIFYFCARGANPNIMGYENFESYKKEINNIDQVTEINLPQCLEVGNNAFSCQKLKKVNLPKCEKIGNQAFLHSDEINEICISKNIDLQSNYTRQFLQSILDKGGILKYIDEDGKKVQAHSLSEFPNIDKYQQSFS